jgi:hypothetical protein
VSPLGYNSGTTFANKHKRIPSLIKNIPLQRQLDKSPISIEDKRKKAFETIQ